MKKTFIMAAVAALMVACGGNADTRKAEQDAAAQDAAATETAIGMEGSVEDLTDDNAFRPDTKVDRLTVLDFNATWCGPCRQLTPVFEQAAKAFPQVRFVSIDVDRNGATAQAFAVEAVPTVVILKPDGTAERYVGTEDLLPYDAFAALLKTNL